MPLEVHSPFSPKGDQPEAIKSIVEGLGDGLSYQTLLGATGTGKTFTMAKIIEETQRPALILAPNKILTAQLAGEFREFFPLMCQHVICLLKKMPISTLSWSV